MFPLQSRSLGRKLISDVTSLFKRTRRELVKLSKLMQERRKDRRKFAGGIDARSIE